MKPSQDRWMLSICNILFLATAKKLERVIDDFLISLSNCASASMQTQALHLPLHCRHVGLTSAKAFEVR